MSYFLGKNLERKISEFGLTSLDKKLTDVVNGIDKWPGNIILTVKDLNILEPLRTVVYSILHKHGQKRLFTVKMYPYMNKLSVSMKQEIKAASVTFPTLLDITDTVDMAEKQEVI